MYNPTKPLALSNSSANVFNSCERKGYFQYIEKRKPDSDWVKPGYFAFGIAYHAVLEKCQHNSKNYSPLILEMICKKENLYFPSDGAKLASCINAYWAMINDSIYKPYTFEKWFENDLARGKIDLICTTDEGWLICDTKTNGMALSPTKKMELINDSQMNLYGAFHDIIGKSCNLDPKKWIGCLYREVEKPRSIYKAGESYDEFYSRIAEKGIPKTREIFISRDEMKWDNAYNNFLLTVKRAREIQKSFIDGNPIETRQDFSQCKKFGTPCEFWSQCYNCLYTSSKSEELKTILSYL
jgi:hypothetical protein